jgi:hypothetical protein
MPGQVPGLCRDPASLCVRGKLPPIPLAPDRLSRFQNRSRLVQNGHPHFGDPHIVTRLHPICLANRAPLPPLDAVDDRRVEPVGQGNVVGSLHRHLVGKLCVDRLLFGCLACIESCLAEALLVILLFPAEFEFPVVKRRLAHNRGAICSWLFSIPAVMFSSTL